MKKIFIPFACLILTYSSYGQITKTHWLIGGNATFFSSKNSFESSNYSQNSESTQITISPNVGFFLLDKFAGGLRTTFSKFKDEVTTTGGGTANINRFEIGPFLRYYLLDDQKQFNILVDISNQWGTYRFKPAKGSITTFSALSGPVIFFNTSVGLEFLVGYYMHKEDIENTSISKQKGLRIVIGFQIHLQDD